MSGPPLEGGEPVSIPEWIRDGALGGLGANLAAVAAVVGLASALDGPGTFGRIVAQPSFYGALVVVLGAGAVFGALAGAGGAALWRVLAGRWLVLLPLGFPVGFAMGAAEGWLLYALVFGGAGVAQLALLGGAGGALALGLGWALYLVLRVGGRPGIAAVVLLPVLSVGAVLAPLSLLLWWERP